MSQSYGWKGIETSPLGEYHFLKFESGMVVPTTGQGTVLGAVVENGSVSYTKPKWWHEAVTPEDMEMMTERLSERTQGMLDQIAELRTELRKAQRFQRHAMGEYETVMIGGVCYFKHYPGMPCPTHPTEQVHLITRVGAKVSGPASAFVWRKRDKGFESEEIIGWLSRGEALKQGLVGLRELINPAKVADAFKETRSVPRGLHEGYRRPTIQEAPHLGEGCLHWDGSVWDFMKECKHQAGWQMGEYWLYLFAVPEGWKIPEGIVVIEQQQAPEYSKHIPAEPPKGYRTPKISEFRKIGKGCLRWNAGFGMWVGMKDCSDPMGWTVRAEQIKGYAVPESWD